MAQNRIALAFCGKSRDDAPKVIYCGGDADECARRTDEALASGRFGRVERYRLDSPLVKYADTPAPAPAPSETGEAPAPKAKKGKGKAN